MSSHAYLAPKYVDDQSYPSVANTSNGTGQGAGAVQRLLSTVHRVSPDQDVVREPPQRRHRPRRRSRVVLRLVRLQRRQQLRSATTPFPSTAKSRLEAMSTFCDQRMIKTLFTQVSTKWSFLHPPSATSCRHYRAPTRATRATSATTPAPV